MPTPFGVIESARELIHAAFQARSRGGHASGRSALIRLDARQVAPDAQRLA
jgi:hypothetical protein